MKLTYNAQMILSFILVILGNILTDVFAFWIYRSIAFIICGLLFIPLFQNTWRALTRRFSGHGLQVLFLSLSVSLQECISN